jgi:hypothetical protein
LAFPPGYNKALKFNLAVEFAPEYGKQAPPEVVMIAESTKYKLKRTNLQVPKVGFEPITPGVGAFDIQTGEE